MLDGRRVNELVVARCVTLRVVYTLLVDLTGHGQVALLSHVVDHLEVFVYLLRGRQAVFVDVLIDLLVQVVLLVFKCDVLGRHAVKVNPLIVKSVEIGSHFLETRLAFLRGW